MKTGGTAAGPVVAVALALALALARALAPARALALAPAAVLLLSACAATTVSPPAWVSSHPDTSAFSLATSAPGICAITVRYPDEAPSAIDYRAGVYVQVGRQPHATPGPGDTVIGRSGDWQVVQHAGADLLLLTPSSTYDYRLEATC